MCVSTPAGAPTASAPAPYPRPGDLVDIGGCRLHLHCTGEGKPSEPTVVLEAGWVISRWSGAWCSRKSRVSPASARTTVPARRGCWKKDKTQFLVMKLKTQEQTGDAIPRRAGLFD